MRYRVLKRRSRPKRRVDNCRPERQTVRVSARDFKRLGEAVYNRRAELGESQDEFVARANMSVKTLQRIESGREVRAGTLGELNRAAKWEPGSAQAILAGGQPTPEKDPSSIHDDDSKDVAELKRMAALLLEHAELLQQKIDAFERRRAG